ncbi:MAG: CofC, 2-Phospho-l-lactate Guanylyltransferase [Frankiales bacterium]|nr:CofC, 2-Phospho-l-lactate Guanylyltransferase [Frankiales bacterium]
MSGSWGLVVPVKVLHLAKSRLAPYGDVARAELALAFAGDVVAAALRCASVCQVVIVTDDVRAAAALAGPGARVEPDVPDAGLNPALAHGAALLRAQHPALGVAALSSDLPSLRPEDLEAALAAVRDRAFVADEAGIGTTLLAAAPGHDLRPEYGPQSRARHLASGAVELPGTPALRRDVDTPADLAAALRLGVGPRTEAAVTALQPAGAFQSVHLGGAG